MKQEIIRVFEELNGVTAHLIVQSKPRRYIWSGDFWGR